MRVEVLLFAALRDAAGSDTLLIELAEDACASDVINAVSHALPAVAALMPACRVAIDSCYVSGDEKVVKDCEVALIPPVSGG